MLQYPLAIAGCILGVTAVIGAIMILHRRRAQFRGYREIASDVKILAASLHAEIFRDGNDLVISGNYRDIPIILRFSNDENTPSVMIEMRVPSTCHLQMAPKRSSVEERRRQLFDLHSRVLEERFIARSSTPQDMEMLLEQAKAVKALEQLCCSSKTFLELSPGKLELRELLFPAELSSHVLHHIEAAGELSGVLASLPGSHAVKIAHIVHERSSFPFRAALAAGVIVATISVLAATRERQKPVVVAATDSSTIHGIAQADAAIIPFPDQWRAATADDFDPAFISWLNAIGQPPSFHLTFDPDQTARSLGAAYLLVNQDGAKRIVILRDHHVIFDSSFQNIAGIARVPATSFPKIQWNGMKGVHRETSGDGILLVRAVDDPHSAVMLYFQNGSLQSACPSDYRSIGLEEEPTKL